MDAKNYSIIIPHKNTPNLLKRCIDSIPRRSDIQIIVVDDNSDPEKVDFANFPGLEDDCIEIYFTREGKGAGYARNIGLSHAKGKWVMFADSDDFFNDDFLSEINRFYNSDCDIIYFSVDCVLSDDISKPGNRSISKSLRDYYNTFQNNKEKGEELFRYNFTEPWAKMIRHELILNNKINFDETMIANDFMFSIKTGFYATKIDASPVKIYTLTERPDSLSANSLISYSKVKIRIGVAVNVELFLKEKGIKKTPSPLRGLVVIILKNHRKEFFATIKGLHRKGISIPNLIFQMFNPLYFNYKSNT